MSILSPAAGYFKGNPNNSLVPKVGGAIKDLLTELDAIPTPWNTGQALSLTPGDTKYDYIYQTTFDKTPFYQGFRMTYNGTPVVYVPADFVNRGFYDNNTREQYFSTAYLNKDIYSYLKPAKLDLSLVDSSAKTSDFLKKFDNRDQGYIIEESKFKELGGSKAVTKQAGYGVHAFGEYKWNAPIQGITEKDGKLVYAGLRGSPSASGEYTTYGEGSQSNHQAWHKSSGFIPGVSNAVSQLGPAVLLLNLAVPGLGTAIYAGNQIGQGIATGNMGQVARGAIALMMPVDGAPPVVDIPGVSTLASTISTATGLSVATSGAMLQSAINYAATGGNIGNFLKGELASYLGAQAGGFVDKLVGSAGFAGMNTIAKAVASSSTKAFLLNQDVSKAVTSAFADTAVPLALKNTPGWDKLSKTQQTSLTNGAISAAKGGKVDIGTVIKNYTTDVFSDAALKAIPGSDKWTAAQTKLAKDTIAAGVQGKSLDGPLQSYMINQAKTAVNDQVAKAEGWESDAQKQGAKGQYGSAIKPDDYTARQQGWEDLAAKQAAIKSYGDTITPVGVKERDQVKSVDPKFDAEAYLKLNEVTGDPFQHFLTQGNKAKLPTNYESGAEAALKSLGYKASADEVKQVADLFKKSADPDVALGKFYDEHWVTQEEAAAAAKQAGFDLTPEQLKTFVGQTTGGQNTVLEDVARAAQIGKEAQQQRTQYLDSKVEYVRQTYKDQGYSDAQINAALPGIRNNLSVGIDQMVGQAADYANQVKAAYGENSKEYAAAQKKLLDTQAVTGSAGVVKNGNNFETTSGETRSADTPTKADTWMSDKTKAPATVTGESGDFLRLTTGAGTPSKATEAIKKETALIGIPGEKPPVTSPTGTEKTAYIGEMPSGTGTGKVPTLFGIPLAVTAADLGSDAWQRVDQSTWVTPDRKYTFIATPGGGEVRDTATKNVVVTLPPADVAKVIPATPATPTTPVTPPKDPVADAVKAAQKAADEGRISQSEAEDALRKLGYTFKPEEAAALTGEKTPEKLAAEALAYVDPRMVTEAEVRKAYQEAGLPNPTQEDVKRFLGQRAQNELPGQIGTYLPTASANVITEQVSALKAAQDAAAAKQAADQAAAKAAADQAAAKNAADKAAADQAAAKAAADQAAASKAAQDAAAAKQAADQAAAAKQAADIQTKLTATDNKLSDFAVQTGQNFADVKAGFDAAFKDAQAKGASTDAALQAGIDKVGQTAAANQKATDAQLGQLGVDVNAVKTGLGQLGASTTQQFGDVNARIAELQKQGLTQSEATNKALLELSSGQATLGQQQAAQAAAAKEAAAQAAANQQATQTQFGDVNARIVELMRQGADYQTATTQAQTELKQGQAQLGTKVGELGTKVGDLGTTLGGQLAGLGTQLTAAKQQATQAQQQANMGTLFGLLGGFGGQQAPAPAPQPTPLANIGYVYDIGGKSIFANPQQEKAFVSPYAEGGTVEDLMKILRG